MGYFISHGLTNNPKKPNLSFMKTLTFTALAIFAFALTSCSRYQVNVISSNNTSKNQQNGNFEYENDSVKISYSFYGQDAPVTVNVYNKLDNPIYVDWEKSALIIGDKAVSYTPDNVSINGSINAETNSYKLYNPALGNPSYTTGNINAVANLPKHTTFLPPHSQGSNTSVHLANGFLQIPDSAFTKVRMLHIDEGMSTLEKVKTANFEKLNSPLVFKSYLTLYLVNGNDVKPVTYQQDFYVSKTFTTLKGPENFQGYEQKRGDYFILSKATGYSKVVTGVVVVGAIGGAAALNNSANNQNK